MSSMKYASPNIQQEYKLFESPTMSVNTDKCSDDDEESTHNIDVVSLFHQYFHSQLYDNNEPQLEDKQIIHLKEL